jgi:hypothetical protein
MSRGSGCGAAGTGPPGRGRRRRGEPVARAEQPALGEAGAELVAQACLGGGLDVLDEDRRPGALGLGGDRVDDRRQPAARPAAGARQVDLEHVGREHSHHRQRALGRADVVERHRAAQRAQVGDAPEQRGGPARERALGDLDGDDHLRGRARVQAAQVERQERRRVGLDVEEQHARRAQAGGDGRVQRAALAQPVELVEAPGVARRGEQRRRGLERAARRAAGERLVADRAAGREVDHRLEADLDRAKREHVAERRANAPGAAAVADREPCDGGRRWLGGVIMGRHTEHRRRIRHP